MLPSCVLLLGPTASGKTAVSLEMAQRLHGEIISVDSALVYRDMNVGTAKPETATRGRTRHHLVDIIDPDQRYSVAAFRQDALHAMADITRRGKMPLLVGGTMMYVNILFNGLSPLPSADKDLRKEIETRAAEKGWPHLHAELRNLDPETAARLQPNDAQRIQRALEVCYITKQTMAEHYAGEKTDPLPYNMISIALLPSNRRVLHERIAQRFDAMLNDGLVDELKGLQSQYALHENLPSMRAVGYRQAWEHLRGDYDLNQLRDRGVAATRQLAKRQLTWLRAMPELIVFDCLESNLAKKVIQYVQGKIILAG